MAVIDPTTLSKPTAVLGAFDPNTNTGVVPLNGCSPNGATVGPGSNLLLGCTPGNNPSDTTTLVINALNKNYSHVFGITGSDEVWFNSGDQRYYTGSSGNRPSGIRPTVPFRARRDRRHQRADRDDTARQRLSLGCGRLQ